jgi:hypothetical protein
MSRSCDVSSRRLSRLWRQTICVAVATTIAAAFCAPARADIYCSGTINEYLVYCDGTLAINASSRNDWITLCGTQGVLYNVSVETCMTWYSTIAAAKIHNKTIGIYYGTNLPCASLPTYGSSLAPSYVRMQ